MINDFVLGNDVNIHDKHMNINADKSLDFR